MTEQEKLEKVIKGLECCAAMSGDECKECPYSKECLDTDLPYGMPHLAADALALLKEQEPIAPVKVNRYMETDENGDWFFPETYDCGYCGVELCGKANYCHLCGQAVKW